MATPPPPRWTGSSWPSRRGPRSPARQETHASRVSLRTWPPGSVNGVAWCGGRPTLCDGMAPEAASGCPKTPGTPTGMRGGHVIMLQGSIPGQGCRRRGSGSKQRRKFQRGRLHRADCAKCFLFCPVSARFVPSRTQGSSRAHDDKLFPPKVRGGGPARQLAACGIRP
jgi:hypothetical protein